jgi:hypothetical protein
MDPLALALFATRGLGTARWPKQARERRSTRATVSLNHGDVRHLARTTPKLKAKFAPELHDRSQRLTVTVRRYNVYGDRKPIRAYCKSPIRIRIKLSFADAEPSGPTERSRRSQKPSHKAGHHPLGHLAAAHRLQASLVPAIVSRRSQRNTP